MSQPDLKRSEVYYPESDGKPMAETDLHRQLMTELVESVRLHFQDDPEVYVSGNLLIYYREGDPRKSVAPDFFMVRGVPKGRRETYRIWDEGKGPDVVIEVTSKTTHREDEETKPAIFEKLQVREFFLFDPYGEWLRPPLRGYRLEGGIFQPLAEPREEEGALVLHSEVLELELRARGESLRLRDPRSGKLLLTPRDLARLAAAEARVEVAEARAGRERSRADRERRRAEAAEAELARVRKELSRRQGKRDG
jgi:Uma2 family endonuclease